MKYIWGLAILIFIPFVSFGFSTGSTYAGGAGSLGAFSDFSGASVKVYATSTAVQFDTITVYGQVSGSPRCWAMYVADDGGYPDYDTILSETSSKTLDSLGGLQAIDFTFSGIQEVSLVYDRWVSVHCEYNSSGVDWFGVGVASISYIPVPYGYVLLNDSGTVVHDRTSGGFGTILVDFGDSVASSGYLTSQSPCVGDTRISGEVECTTPLASVTEFTGTLETLLPYQKLELRLYDSGATLLDSVAYVYDTAGYREWDWYSVTVGTSTESVYRLTSCLVPVDSFSDFGFGNCLSQVWGNGTSTDDYFAWRDGYADSDSQLSLYNSLGCDDVSILSFASSTKCAFIWAFYPDFGGLGEKLRNLGGTFIRIPPWGYVTILRDQFTGSISTPLQNESFNLGQLTGVGISATTTIDYVTMASSTMFGMVSGIEDMVRPFLYFFGILFLLWFMIYKLPHL